MRRGAEFSIMSGAVELMNSRLSGSEKALATLAFRGFGDRPDLQVLIGGLGMGFTLRAALAQLGPRARVAVAELVPAVIGWAHGPLLGLFAGSLTDPRVTLHEADVAHLIAPARSRYDAILLDVDNGPGGLNRAANDGLYAADGLRAAARALAPGGVLAVWSAGPNAEFARRLHRTGFRVDEARVRANRPGRGARHVIWVASPGPG
ncbi:spermidine synthase [Phenylobacterium sp.]|uniref:spermidine synthase n=1 Tax=Phenylobacterium sp. TaxID=1871053 RepID=UPI002F40D8C6